MEISLSVIELILIFLQQAKLSPIFIGAVPYIDCVISELVCSGGFHHHIGRRDFHYRDQRCTLEILQRRLIQIV